MGPMTRVVGLWCNACVHCLVCNHPNSVCSTIPGKAHVYVGDTKAAKAQVHMNTQHRTKGIPDVSSVQLSHQMAMGADVRKGRGIECSLSICNAEVFM